MTSAVKVAFFPSSTLEGPLISTAVISPADWEDDDDDVADEDDIVSLLQEYSIEEQAIRLTKTILFNFIMKIPFFQTSL